MIRDITKVLVVGDHQLRLVFEDGAEGTVDVGGLVEFKGVMAPLASPEYFARVELNQELGTVCWPNGADLDPIVLYSEVTGEPLPPWSRDVEPAIR